MILTTRCVFFKTTLIKFKKIFLLTFKSEPDAPPHFSKSNDCLEFLYSPKKDYHGPDKSLIKTTALLNR